MEKDSDNLLPFSRNLQANGAQFFWDTLYTQWSFTILSGSKIKNLHSILNRVLHSILNRVYHPQYGTGSNNLTPYATILNG